jgi:hypothetical protein
MGKNGQTTQGSSQPRSIDWIEILKVVAMPIVITTIGLVINSSLSERQSIANDLRLYADMMARREQADSDLRKDMFKSILDKFAYVSPDPKSVEYLDQQIVNLELLAYNFHESIDLGPLFKHVRGEIPDRRPESMELVHFKRYEKLRRRLERVAVEVDERQLTVVGDTGVVVRACATGLDSMDEAPAFLRFTGPNTVAKKDLKPEDGVTQVCLSLRSSDKNGAKAGDEHRHYRRFKLEIIDFDVNTREVQVRLYVSKPLGFSDCRSVDLDKRAYQEIDVAFWLGLFSLPMIDNTRLSHSERTSVSLTELSPNGAQIALAYFHSSRASLKDKPYYDELAHDLLRRESKSEDDAH